MIPNRQMLVWLGGQGVVATFKVTRFASIIDAGSRGGPAGRPAIPLWPLASWPLYLKTTVVETLELFWPLAFGMKPTRTRALKGLEPVDNGTSSVTFWLLPGCL